MTLYVRAQLRRIHSRNSYGWIAITLLLVLIACTSSATSDTTDLDFSPVPAIASNASTPTIDFGKIRTDASATKTATRLPDDPTELMRATAFGNLTDIAKKMVESGNQSFIPVLLEIMRIDPNPDSRFAWASTISKLADGEDLTQKNPERTDWGWWIEWLGQNSQIVPPKGYAAWKGELFSTVDPGLGSFLYDGVKTEIRLEEVVWGGVPKDGIPDLQNPPVLPANEAWYMTPTDRVFGVSFNGEHRAYPLRILNAHEMANDVVGGVPFALAY